MCCAAQNGANGPRHWINAINTWDLKKTKWTWLRECQHRIFSGAHVSLHFCDATFLTRALMKMHFRDTTFSACTGHKSLRAPQTINWYCRTTVSRSCSVQSFKLVFTPKWGSCQLNLLSGLLPNLFHYFDQNGSKYYARLLHQGTSVVLDENSGCRCQGRNRLQKTLLFRRLLFTSGRCLIESLLILISQNTIEQMRTFLNLMLHSSCGTQKSLKMHQFCGPTHTCFGLECSHFGLSTEPTQKLLESGDWK